MKLIKSIITPLNVLLSFFVLSPFILRIITHLLFGAYVPIAGGCFDNKEKFGFPLSFFSITTECATCCLEPSRYPIREFSLSYFAIDMIYLFLVGILGYRIYKQLRIK